MTYKTLQYRLKSSPLRNRIKTVLKLLDFRLKPVNTLPHRRPGFPPELHRLAVIPSLPKELAGLQRIAYNLWWTWEPKPELFKRMDPELWRETRHNPVQMLESQNRPALTDQGQRRFMAHLAGVDEKLQEYTPGKTWFDKTHNDRKNIQIAYFPWNSTP
jgi:hypothetical protein